MLSARCVQKKAETSIYKNAEIGKAESRNVFEEFDHGTGWTRISSSEVCSRLVTNSKAPETGALQEASRHSRVVRERAKARSAFNAGGAAFGEGTHFFQGGHGRVSRECGEQRAVRPAELDGLFRGLACEQALKRTSGKAVAVAMAMRFVRPASNHV
jgi:hypothetical protein